MDETEVPPTPTKGFKGPKHLSHYIFYLVSFLLYLHMQKYINMQCKMGPEEMHNAGREGSELNKVLWKTRY